MQEWGGGCKTAAFSPSDSVAAPLQADDLGVTDQAVGDGGGRRGIAKDVAPGAEGPVGRQDDRGPAHFDARPPGEEIGGLLLHRDVT
jgi:hypothetical protein